MQILFTVGALPNRMVLDADNQRHISTTNRIDIARKSSAASADELTR